MTFGTQNHQALTQCRGLLLWQVSSHSDHGLSSYSANTHTHTIHTHTSRDTVIAIAIYSTEVYTNDLHEALLQKKTTAFWQC